MRSIDEARAEVDRRARRIRRRRRLAAALSCAAFAAVLVLVLVGTPRAAVDTGPVATVPAPEGTTTAPTTAAVPPIGPNDTSLAAAAIASEVADGWVPYSGAFALDPMHVPTTPQGYLKWGEGADEEGRANVYDRPDGAVIGYAYRLLGYVPLADAPGFDPSARRIERFGCDPIRDPACAERLALEIERSAEGPEHPGPGG